MVYSPTTPGRLRPCCSCGTGDPCDHPPRWMPETPLARAVREFVETLQISPSKTREDARQLAARGRRRQRAPRGT